MRNLILSLFVLLLVATSCKKDAVDATNTKTFQASINDMASSLNTLGQVKFNEALYILKTFGVEGETEVEKLAALGKKLQGLKVPQILALADEVAQSNGIAWTSTGPPSLGEMNIFAVEEATTFDPNDIKASSLTITTIEVMKDSILGAKGIQVIPRLVDASGKPIEFSGAALEAVMEVYSEGTKISTTKNLMLDNDFKGFTIKLASIPMQKVPNGNIDVTVTVNTTHKNYKMSKVGIPVNINALKPMPVLTGTEEPSGAETPSETGEATAKNDPKTTVTRFLNHLGSQNLRGAFEASENPNWGSYEQFSNPTSGFGGVKNLSVKNISTNSTSDNTASVNATYDVTGQDGKVTALQVTFGLKNINGNWKITSYKIN